ncbi:MAG TPA: TlpA disulfide reductase family protein [Labilithrix sp.]|nr:TlpA disulfide reductase family protein [Labilithrix sp.]
MRKSTLGASLAIALLPLTLPACSEDPPVRDPSTANEKKSSGSHGAAAAAAAPNEITCSGKPDVGKNASSFKVSTLGGGRAGLEKGKVYIVDFWATWCEPCKKSFPKYQDLYVKYKASGLEIVAISVDDEKKDIPDFIRTYGAKFPVGWDEGHKIADCFKPSNMPSAYVIDKNGVIRHVHTGFRAGEERELEKEIKALL